MSNLSVLGGIGRGLTYGIHDLQQRDEVLRRRRIEDEDLAFQRGQRERLMRQQATEDALQNEVAGLRRSGTYTEEEVVPGFIGGAVVEQVPAIPDGMAALPQGQGVTTYPVQAPRAGALPTDVPLSTQSATYRAPPQAPAERRTKTTTVSDADYARALAGAYQRSGLPQYSAQALQLMGTARQLDAADAKLAEDANRRAIFNKYRPMVERINRDPEGYLSEFFPGWYNSQIQDGQFVIAQRGPGGTVLRILDAEGRELGQREVPRAMAHQAAMAIVDGMISRDLGLVSDADWAKQYELGLRNRQTGAAEATAAAATSRARTDIQQANNAAALIPDQIGLLRAQARWHDRRGDGSGAGGVQGVPPEVINEYAQLELQLGRETDPAKQRQIQVRMNALANRVRMLAGQAPLQLTQDRAAAGIDDKGMVEAGFVKLNGQWGTITPDGTFTPIATPQSLQQMSEAIVRGRAAQSASGVTPQPRAPQRTRSASEIWSQVQEAPMTIRGVLEEQRRRRSESPVN